MKQTLTFIFLFLCASQNSNIFPMSRNQGEKRRISSGRHEDLELGTPQAKHKEIAKSNPEQIVGITPIPEELVHIRTRQIRAGFEQLLQEKHKLASSQDAIELELNEEYFIPANPNLTANSIISIVPKTLYEQSLKNISLKILTYSPIQLIELLTKFGNKEMFRSSLEFEITRKLTFENVNFFSLKIQSTPIYIFQHNASVDSATFSPDGTQVLTASADNTAKLWNLANGSLVRTFTHNNQVTSAIFSPDGRQVLTASWDGTAKLWNLDGSLVQTFNHNDWVTSVKFSPDGSQILTSSNYNYITKLWNLDGSLVQIFHVNHDETVIPDGGTPILAITQGQYGPDWTPEQSFCLTSTIFSTNQKQILTILLDNTAKLWNKTCCAFVQTFAHNSFINAAVFSPDGTQVLTSSNDQTAKLWKIHPLLYKNISIAEFALILLILQYKSFVKSNPNILGFVINLLEQVDGDVPEEQKYIKNYFMQFLAIHP